MWNNRTQNVNEILSSVKKLKENTSVYFKFPQTLHALCVSSFVTPQNDLRPPTGLAGDPDFPGSHSDLKRLCPSTRRKAVSGSWSLELSCPNGRQRVFNVMWIDSVWPCALIHRSHHHFCRMWAGAANPGLSSAHPNKRGSAEPAARVKSQREMTGPAPRGGSVGSRGAPGEGLCSFHCENAAGTHIILKGMGRRGDCTATGKRCAVAEISQRTPGRAWLRPKEA